MLNPAQLICLGSLTMLTASCQLPFTGNPDKVEFNLITEQAHHFQAKYGMDYILKGDRVAQYPDFDISLYSVYHNPATENTTYTYEITSKDGYEKRKITFDSVEDEKKHFYVDNTHFYYHSNGAYALNIYMPPQLLAHQAFTY